MEDAFFSAFPPTPTEAWEAQLQRELRGADYQEKLIWQHPDGYAINPYYRRDPAGSTPAGVPGLDRPITWSLLPRYTGPLTAVALREAAAASASREGQGLALWLTREEAETMAPSLTDSDAKKPFAYHAWLTDPRKPSTDGPWCLDAGMRQAQRGQLADADDWDALLSHGGPVYLDGAAWTDAGAGAVTELAALLAAATAWLGRAIEVGKDPVQVANQLTVRLAAGPHFFPAMAKFRAWRILWDLLGEGFAEGDSAATWPRATVHGTSSTWNLPRADRHSNLIRLSQQSMSAAAAGADVLEVPGFDHAFGEAAPDSAAFSKRISENIALLLRYESHLERVADPGAGSWYLESLTDQLGEAAWIRFQAIEEVGGYGSSLATGLLPGWVAEDRALRTEALAKGEAGWIGVNRFPSNLEPSPDPATAPTIPANTEFPPLQAWAAEAGARQEQTSKP